MGASSAKGEKMGIAAVMTLYFFSLGFSIVTPAMAKFAEAFPDQEYALINSLPTIFIGVTGLILGIIAGRKVKFRTLAITGSALSLVAGVGPAFISDFYLILVCRALLGVGLGMLIPLANALVNGNYEGQRKAKLLSMGSLMLNAGGIILQTLGGVLADISWQTTFYGYILFVFALAMSFFIPETEVGGATSFSGLDRRLALIVALFMIYGIFQFSVMQNTAELFESRNAGGATVSALALSIFTVAGCAGGLGYMAVRKACPRAVFPVIWISSAVGCILMAMLTDAVSMTLGLAVLGIGFGMIIPAFVDWTGKICTVATVSLGTAIATSSMYIGDFLSMAWKPVADSLFGEYIVSNLEVMAGVTLLFAVVFVVFNPFSDKVEE